MKKIKNPKLKFNANTLRQLQPTSLEQVQGGISRVCTSWADCGPSHETVGCPLF